MITIDADAHVVETEATWSYMDGADEKYRPILVTSRHEVPGVPPDISLEEMLRRPSFFVCDDQAFPTATVASRHYPSGAQFPSDIKARIRHLDELGIDVQVLYPSVFLDSAFRSVDAECALVRSYNRWVADLCSSHTDRLRWAVVICASNVEFSLRQMEEGRRKGACAVFMKGYENDRMIDDTIFFPIYAKASELDLPIAIHSGIATQAMKRMVHGKHANFAALTLPVIAAMAALYKSGIPKRFPTLRVGFLEAAAAWIPFVVYRADAGWNTAHDWTAHRQSFLGENRFYVTVEPHEDIPMLLSYGAGDSLMVATDYGHSDGATAITAHIDVRKRADVSPAIANKLLGSNAAKFYGI